MVFFEHDEEIFDKDDHRLSSRGGENPLREDREQAAALLIGGAHRLRIFARETGKLRRRADERHGFARSEL